MTSDMIRPFLLALTGLAAIIILKGIVPEFAVPIRLAVICAVLAFALSGVDQATEYISSFSALGDIDVSFVKIALKVTGICIVSQSVADICRDSAETALASQVELVGRMLILAVSLPLAKTLLEMSLKLIK